MLFCSPLHVHFSPINHLLLAPISRSNWQNSQRFLLESLQPLNNSAALGYQIGRSLLLLIPICPTKYNIFFFLCYPFSSAPGWYVSNKKVELNYSV